MTLPATGQITFYDINIETGQTGNFSSSLSWIKANTKTGQEADNIGAYHGKAWYSRNMDGNCNNGNCTVTNCDCGNINCVNCKITGTVNCANCDTRSWLQNNCNCACTYNCTFTTISYNCNCNCACNSSCFVEGSLVLMADGSYKNIEDIKIGDKVLGGGGYINTVIAYDRPKLGKRFLYRLNGSSHMTTDEHPHFGPYGYHVINKESFSTDRTTTHSVLYNDGHIEKRLLPSLSEDYLFDLLEGTELFTPFGTDKIVSIEIVKYPSSTQLFNLALDGSHTYFVDGFLVSGWGGDWDFDYVKWRKK